MQTKRDKPRASILEADFSHKRNFNRGAASVLVDLVGMPEEEAKKVITAIAKNLIPHVTINY